MDFSLDFYHSGIEDIVGLPGIIFNWFKNRIVFESNHFRIRFSVFINSCGSAIHESYIHFKFI